MKAYKVFNPNWTCLGFQFEVGKTYTQENPIMCEIGFHACTKVSDCFNYYSFDPNNKVAEVELSGTILGLDSDKQCAETITIVKELSWNEMLELANTGKGNSGHRNSGYRNSGDSNSGNWNSGDRNSGHRNSGYRNSGDWNSGDWNSGNFNSKTPLFINVFNMPCNIEDWENIKKPDFIYNVVLSEWVDFINMTDIEKIKYPKLNGCLRTYSYKEAWRNAYSKANEKDVKLLKNLPNFDADVFKEITGIDVNNETENLHL